MSLEKYKMSSLKDKIEAQAEAQKKAPEKAPKGRPLSAKKK